MSDKPNENTSTSTGELHPGEGNLDLTAVCAKLVDTTDKLTNMTADLADARRQVAMASLAKSTFLATLSHELRTPLNAIIGFSDLMKAEWHGPLGADVYRLYVSDVNESGRKLLSLIDDLLELSRIELGQPVLKERLTDIGLLLKSCLTLMSDRARAAGLSPKLAVDDHLPYAWVDSVKLKQAIMHLADNAIKYTKPGGRITLSAVLTEDNALVLCIEDNGVGIAAAELPKALEAFRQLDDLPTRRHGGMGLGLPLAKSIAELHGGEFTIESAPDVGTKVTIVLPPDRVIKDKERPGASE
jgi:two-component system cell cycle sensor histidine kinase PleC